MSGPLKIIHRYRNSKGYLGYKVFIFLRQSDKKNSELMSLLGKIQNLSMSETLRTLKKQEATLLLEAWGTTWYKCLFNVAHIDKERKIIPRDKSLTEHISSILSKEWYEEHISKPTDQHAAIRTKWAELVRMKRLQKIRQKGGGDDNEDELELFGEEEEVIDDEGDVADFEEEEEQTMDDEEDGGVVNLEDVVIDKKVEDTTKSINKVLKNTTFAFEYGDDDPFEKQKDDQDIKDTFSKNYIVDCPIYWDDTIQKIKAKVCDSIRLHPRFKQNLLTPSRLYLWSEYVDPLQTTDFVTIGHKWIRRIDLVSVNARPEKNVQVYSRLGTDSVKALYDVFERLGSRIKREDDSNLTLYDYRDYINGNELFMIDIYTQIDLPTLEVNKNFITTFVKAYFPIALQDINDIVEYVREGGIGEQQRMQSVHASLHNDLRIEKGIAHLVDETLIDYKEYTFHTPTVIQAINQTDLFFPPQQVDLDTMFQNFTCSENYPFIQLLKANKTVRRRIFRGRSPSSSLSDQVLLLSQWFRGNALGLTIKILTPDNKYVTVIISDMGRVFYKVQFREVDDQTTDSIRNTFPQVEELIRKINTESKTTLPIPKASYVKFIFINSTQKFKLPQGALIDHNRLSDFARYFFPYVAVVIEPKRKQGGADNMGRWGTYLRFKRVSNYGDVALIRKRIINSLKNYAITEAQLVRVLENEFNMATEDAVKHIQQVTSSVTIVPNSTLKPVIAIPKTRPIGIGVEIQGKTPETFKIRVIGARSKDQMQDIYAFVNKLLYLYHVTVASKTKESQRILERLEGLTNIAKKRQIVRDVVHAPNLMPYKSNQRKFDADKFYSTEGQQAYTRQCQNSGKLIRRPKPVIGIENLKKLGYKLNKVTKRYEKQVKHPLTKKMVTIVAARIFQKGQEIFYVCDPSIHKEQFYIGILSKSDPVLPCCFKKNQLTSQNPVIRKTFEQYLDGENHVDKNKDSTNVFYVKKLAGKTTPSRFHFLPHTMNTLLQDQPAVFYQSRLEASPKGHLFIWGTETGDLRDIFAWVFSESVNTMWKKLADIVENIQKSDPTRWESIFCFLGNGIVRTRYQTNEAFIETIKKQNLDILILIDLLIVCRDINIVIIDAIADNECFVRCPSYHDAISDLCLIIMDSNGMYHPVVSVLKERKDSEKAIVQKRFPPESSAAKKVAQIINFSCSSSSSSSHGSSEIINVSFYKQKGIKVQSQVLNHMLQMIMVIDDKGTPLPVFPTTCDPRLPISKSPQLKPLSAILTTFKKLPWIRPIAVLAENKRVKGLKTEIGGPLDSVETIIPVQESSIADIGDSLVVEQEYTSKTDDDERLFVVKLEALKHEMFMILKTLLGQKLQTKPQDRKDIIDNITARRDPDKVARVIRATLENSISRSPETSQEWSTKRRSNIIRVAWGVQRNTAICSDKHALHNIVDCDEQGRWIIPTDWYEEFITRITLDIINFQTSGKEVLSIDRYRIPDHLDRIAMPEEREDTELPVHGTNVDLKHVVRILYGDGASSMLQTTTPRRYYGYPEVTEQYMLKDHGQYYSQRILTEDEAVLRGLVNCLYHLLHRKRYGSLELSNLGATNTLQTTLLHTVKGKGVAWLMNNRGFLPPPQTGVKEPITYETILSFQNDRIADERWLFGVWVFHRIFNDIPIRIVTPSNTTRFTLMKGKILDGPQTNYDAQLLKSGLVCRLSPPTGVPSVVDSIYYKD